MGDAPDTPDLAAAAADLAAAASAGQVQVPTADNPTGKVTDAVFAGANTATSSTGPDPTEISALNDSVANLEAESGAVGGASDTMQASSPANGASGLGQSGGLAGTSDATNDVAAGGATTEANTVAMDAAPVVPSSMPPSALGAGTQAVSDAGAIGVAPETPAPAAMPMETGQPAVNAAATDGSELSGLDAVKIAQRVEAPAAEDAASAAEKPKSGIALFFDRLKTMDVKNFDLKALFQKGPNGEQDLVTGTATMFEINLIPAVKNEMITALKLRNLVLFIAIVVVAISGGIVALLGSVYAGQIITVNGQKDRIEEMSKKIQSFDGLNEYLTIRDQLDAIKSIEDQKLLLSRVFTFLSAMLPQAPDSITLSKLTVDMQSGTLSMEGQADAGVAPFIDYRVLESFKKTMQLVKYDYGSYVDEEGNAIPTRCMVEERPGGGVYNEMVEHEGQASTQAVYAYWIRSKDGCDVTKAKLNKELAALQEEIDARVEEAKENSDVKAFTKAEIRDMQSEIYENYPNIYETWYDKWLESNKLTRTSDLEELTDEQQASLAEASAAFMDSLNDEEAELAADLIADGMDLRDLLIEKVWRTPNFAEWYQSDDKTYDEDAPNITLDGTITNVAHYESAECQRYTGQEVNGVVMWSVANDCTLADKDVEIIESSNGRDSSGTLVLRFRALVTLKLDALNFQNKHVIAISPSGQNVTDSYVQVKQLFGEAATECGIGDTICVDNTQNTGTGTTNDKNKQTEEEEAVDNSTEEGV